MAYSVYRAFTYKDFSYPYFEKLQPSIYRRSGGNILNGLKVWPDDSPPLSAARQA